MGFLSGLLSRRRFHRGFPVLPGAVPLLGHLPRLMYDATSVMREGEAQLGPAFWVKLGPGVELLFLLGAASFELFKHRALTMEGAFAGLEPLIGGSTIVKDGPPHVRVRAALSASFSLRGLVATGIGPVMASTVAARVDRWIAAREVGVLAETQALALDIIFRVLGVPTSDLPRWHAQNRDFSLLLVPLHADLPGSPRRRGVRAAAWLNASLLEIVRRARAEPDGTSLTHGLVHARDPEGQPLSDRELVDNLRILGFAGHETTASVLAWLTFVLAQRPELWEQLLAEVRRPGAAMPTTIAEAKAFPFAEALFRECLRRYTPAWFTRRRAGAGIEFQSRAIAEGTAIGLCLSSLLTDPAQYERPDRFDPDRWLGRATAPTQLELAAFGGGPHFCLGYHLAWLEVLQFLVALGQKMSAAGLRPRMADGPGPREVFFPLRHPVGGRVAFVA